MFTIATAGHIDHGKSSLVKALTGTDPDRLPEEQRRHMTIELGFASFRLSGGEEVGIIDVPGHERFIRTMISGVGAVDMVLFIVAADDGWMPQSEEHLAILRYLGVQNGLIVLTKVDLVEPEWCDLVRQDLRQRTQGTFLEGCEIIEFSATDNRNLGTLKERIEDTLRHTVRRLPSPSARLYVDRVFSVAGVGTVVTGTLREGSLTVGQEVRHHPGGETIRIRSLESFYSEVRTAPPGVRLAVGLQGLERSAVNRGDLLYTSPLLRESHFSGVAVDLEAESDRYFRHGRKVLLLHGTAEAEALVILPIERLVNEHGSTIAILRTERPLVCKSGDRFILRLPTPNRLIGGGIVIDPLLPPLRRRSGEHWRQLVTASTLEPSDLIRYELKKRLQVETNALLLQSTVPPTAVNDSLTRMVAAGEVKTFDTSVMLTAVWADAAATTLQRVAQYHSENPHQAAMPLSELMGAFQAPATLTTLVVDALVQEGKLERHEAGVRLPQHSVGLTPSQQEALTSIMACFNSNPHAVLSRSEMLALHKEASRLYAYLRQTDQIVDIDGSVYLKAGFDELVARIVEFLKEYGEISVAQARDATGTSRKVIVPLLEELDRRRITKRVGDHRKLRDG